MQNLLPGLFRNVFKKIKDSNLCLLYYKSELLKLIELMSGRELPIHQSRVGEIIGEERFLKKALEKYDRRRTHEDESEGFKRIGEGYFEPLEKVIWEFEGKIGLKLEEINIKSHRGKRLRGELLVLLKDLSGMKYLEIIEIPMFSNLSLNSLPKLYQDAKKRQEASEESV